MLTQLGYFSRRSSSAWGDQIAKQFSLYASAFFSLREDFTNGDTVFLCTIEDTRLLTVHTANRGFAFTFDGTIQQDKGGGFPEARQRDGSGEHFEVFRKGYERLGAHFVSEIEGDFAIACWDNDKRQLILARDSVGARPLYFFCNPDIILWSSNLKFIVSLVHGASSLDYDYIADYLTSMRDLFRTPFESITSVMPGSFLEITERDVRTERFWSLGPRPLLGLGSDIEYETLYREFLNYSLAARLKSQKRVAAELSGGLDSSVLVCACKRSLFADGTVEARILPVSFLYDGSPSCDESVYIDIVSQAIGEPSRKILDPNFLGASNTCSESRPSLWQLYQGTLFELRNIVITGGAELMLSGYGGDQVNDADDPLSSELGNNIGRLRFIVAGRVLGRWATVYRVEAIPLFLSVLRRYFRRNIGRQRNFSRNPKEALRCYGKQFREQYLLDDRYRIPEEFKRGQSTTRARRCFAIHQAIWTACQCSFRDYSLFDRTYPYLDRALVDFMLSVPQSQKMRPGEDRSLQRRSMRSVLPTAIFERRTKEGPDEAVIMAIRRHFKEFRRIANEGHVVQMGFADKDLFHKELQNAKHGAGIPNLPALINLLSLEYWIDAMRRARWPKLAGGPLYDSIHSSTPVRIYKTLA